MPGKYELLTQIQAATLLGVTRDTLRNYVHAGNGPARTLIGKRYYFTRPAIRAWLDSRAIASSAGAAVGNDALATTHRVAATA